jgi:hypothetical protein
LSWEDAKEEAGKWIGSHHLPRDLTGMKIDLSTSPLPFEKLFRSMVLNAIRRKLRNRGATDITLPPPDPEE